MVITPRGEARGGRLRGCPWLTARVREIGAEMGQTLRAAKTSSLSFRDRGMF
jgi:hypothetical protein